jgi:Zn-dependent protease with chaperone function
VVLLCAGVREPALVLSRGTLERLDARELRVALAHELGHLVGRDIPLGWGLMGARALQAFNPVLQLVARTVVLEAERRADDVAVEATGERLALASALLKSFQAVGTPAAGAAHPRTLAARGREAEIEERCRRLLRAPQPPLPFARVRLAATALALSALLFFVT